MIDYRNETARNLEYLYADLEKLDAELQQRAKNRADINADLNLSQTEREKLLEAEHVAFKATNAKVAEDALRYLSIAHKSVESFITDGSYKDAALANIVNACDKYQGCMPVEMQEKLAEDAKRRYLYARLSLKKFESDDSFSLAVIDDVKSYIARCERVREFNFDRIADDVWMALNSGDIPLSEPYSLYETLHSVKLLMNDVDGLKATPSASDDAAADFEKHLADIESKMQGA